MGTADTLLRTFRFLADTNNSKCASCIRKTCDIHIQKERPLLISLNAFFEPLVGIERLFYIQEVI